MYVCMCICNIEGSMTPSVFRNFAEWKLFGRAKLSEDWQTNINGTFCGMRFFFSTFILFLTLTPSINIDKSG